MLAPFKISSNPKEQKYRPKCWQSYDTPLSDDEGLESMDGVDFEDSVGLPYKEEIIHTSLDHMTKEGQDVARIQEYPSLRDLAMHVSGIKRINESGSSDSDKEPPIDHIDNLQVAIMTRPSGGWVEVKNEKKK